MARAVLLAGGWAHPGDDLVAAVTDVVGACGMDLAIVTDPNDMVSSLAQGCDLLVVGACWFSMTDARYTDEQRARFAVELTAEMRAALADLKTKGCPLFAMHTAVICFDGEHMWQDWIGGTWNWETSWHPPPESMLVRFSDERFGRDFSVTDEHYQGLDTQRDIKVIATSATNEPLVWLHDHGTGLNEGKGRVAVNVLGHDARSLREPAHRALNAGLIDWLLTGRTERDDTD